MKKLLNHRLFSIIVLSLVWFIVYQAIFDVRINLGGDNAAYYILGNAINQGHGYTNIHLVNSPPAKHFPPGYSFIIAVLMFVSKKITFIKIVNGLFLLGTSLISYSVFSRILDKRIALVGSLALLLNIHLLSYSTIMMSESSFSFFSILLIYFIIKSMRKDQLHTAWEFYIVIILSFIIFHIRTAGLAMIGAVSLYLLFQKKFIPLLIYIGGFIITALPWHFRNKALGSNAYVKQLLSVNPYRPEEGMADISDLWQRFLENVDRYVGKEIPGSMIPSFQVNYTESTPVVAYITGVIMIILIILGVFKLVKHKSIFGWYLAGTFFILFLWPSVWFGPRFILPLIPLMIILLLNGLHFLVNWLIKLTKLDFRLNPLLLLLLILPFFKEVGKLSDKTNERLDVRFENYFKAGKWCAQNLPKDAIIACRKPHLFYLYSNRQVSGFPSSLDYQVVIDGLKSNNVTHVVLEQLGFSSTTRYLAPTIINNPEKFKVIHHLKNPDTYVIQFDPSYGYTGEWKRQSSNNYQENAVKDGQGTYVYPNNTSYEGEWKNNKRNGIGTIKTNGVFLKGHWKNDQLIDTIQYSSQAN